MNSTSTAQDMRPDTASRSPIALLAPVVFLALLAVITMPPLVIRAFADVEISYNEGWNAYRAQIAAEFIPLYDQPPGWQITNYPPISFHVIGLLGRVVGDVNLAGRLVSLVSVAALCGLISAITRQFVTSGYAAVLSALCFLVWLVAWMPTRIGVNDPQLFGMVAEVWGFYVYLKHQTSQKWICASAAAFCFAVFIKHNLVALPLGVGASLVATGNWRQLALWGGVGLLTMSGLLVVTQTIDGSFFLTNLLHPRAYVYRQIAVIDISYVIVFLPFLMAAAAWSTSNMRNLYRPLSFSWLIAHSVAFMFSVGDGVGGNIFFEGMVITAIITSIIFDDVCLGAGQRDGVKAACLFVLSTAFAFWQSPYPTSLGPRQFRTLPRHESDFATGVDVLRRVSGQVVCEDLLMCYRAGKPSVFDPYFVFDQIKIHQIDECEILSLIIDHRLAAIEIGEADDSRPPKPADRLRFSKRFMTALLRQYAPAKQTGDFTILMPVYGPWDTSNVIGNETASCQ